MGAYLSIDLDFWCDHRNSGAATKFFKKVFALNVPITFVIEHEELLPDVNKMKNLDILYNVDYHSDIISQCDAEKKPQDYEWGNHVKGRRKAEFCWICPDYECYEYNTGTCHGGGDDPFCPQKNSGWKACTWATDLKLIEWDKIERVGVCLSPCFVNVSSVRTVVEKLGMSEETADELVEKQPEESSERTRGVICKIAA